MKNLTKEEYLTLCQQLAEEQYEDSDTQKESIAWTPAVSEVKYRMLQNHFNGVIDLTQMKSAQIKESLYKGSNFQVWTFKMKITNATEKLFDLEFWEERTKTPNGMPCRIDFPLEIKNDSRFVGRPWLIYFGSRGCGNKIPLETVVEIVRWLQAVKKLSAFL